MPIVYADTTSLTHAIFWYMDPTTKWVIRVGGAYLCSSLVDLFKSSRLTYDILQSVAFILDIADFHWVD